MKLQIDRIVYKHVNADDVGETFNQMLCSRTPCKPEILLAYYKMHKNISLGGRYYHDDWMTLMCSPWCDMRTPDVIKVLEHLLLTEDINAIRNNSFTLLLAAVKRDDLPLTQYLVSKGAKFIIDGKVIGSYVNCLDDYLKRSNSMRAFVTECIYKEVTGAA